jgi:hypothetical protein
MTKSNSYPKLRKQKYSLDHTFFDGVDTEEKAYWLGFITADGCIPDNGKNTLTVELKESDASHLQKLCASLKSDRPILLSSRGCVKVYFGSWQIVDSLKTLGLGYRKSGTVRPWSGPAHLMPHYWRGLVDGDGTIVPQRVRNKWTIGLCGSVHCVVEFCNWARGVTGSRALPRQSTHSPSCWYWQTGGTWAPQRLAEALYADATIYLDRKKDLADRLIATKYLNPPKI